MKPVSLSEKRRRAGQLGGITTLMKHGRERMREWGMRGGRPAAPALAEIRQHKAQENKKKEEALLRCNRRELAGLWEKIRGELLRV